VCGIHGFITGVEELRSIVVNLVMLMNLVLLFYSCAVLFMDFVVEARERVGISMKKEYGFFFF
jgi:hypothetical protein